MKKQTRNALLFATIICTLSCQKSKDLKPNSVDAEVNVSKVLSPYVYYYEDFECGTGLYPQSGTTDPHLTYNIENCNGGSTTQGLTYSWTLASSSATASAGTYSARYELRDTQPLVGTSTPTYRSEVSIIKGDIDSRFTTDSWYSMSYYFPTTGFDNDSLSQTVVGQWYEDGREGQIFLMVQNSRFFMVKVNPSDTTKTLKYDLLGAVNASPSSSYAGASTSFVSITRGTWNKFVFHIIHSNTSSGLVEIWRNGTKIQTLSGRSLQSTILPKWKLGIYKSDWKGSPGKSTVHTLVVHIDEIKVGNSSATLSDM